MLARYFRLDAFSPRMRYLMDTAFALLAIALLWAYYLYIDHLFFTTNNQMLCEARQLLN